MKYFIECTQTFHSEFNSGIQRVVRSIVGAAMTLDGPHDMIPVVFEAGAFYGIDDSIRYPAARPVDTGNPLPSKALVKRVLRKGFQGFRRLLARLMPFPVVVNFVYAPPSVWGLSRLVMFPLELARGGKSAFFATPRAPVVIGKDDVLVLLDSSWHTAMWDAVDACRANGTPVVVVIYDLIPITHPQFCVPSVQASFSTWIHLAVPRADILLAISHTIALELQQLLPQFMAPGQARPQVSHFWLGSELDGAAITGGEFDPELARVCAADIPSYVYVSTVEPRKNHRYALEAFETLWARGVTANFLIVGRIGWDCDAFLRDVRHHPQFGVQLFMFNDVEDHELAYVYDSVQGLIFSSVTEGFGLPVVEGLKRGLPVFASDIPVFREIGNEGVQFFDLADAGSMADLIQAHIVGGAARLPAAVSWMTWNESTQQMQARIEQCLGTHSYSPAAAPHPKAESALGNF